MILELDGRKILTYDDFHRALVSTGKFPHYFGKNSHALWDSLTGDVERPFSIIWHEHQFSKDNMPIGLFNGLVDLLRRVEEFDNKYVPKDGFTLELR